MLKVKSIDDLMRCITLSSLLELSGWPKPGNIHRTKNFNNTRFEHFLAGIVAIQPNFRILCERVHALTNKANENCGFIDLGSFFYDAVKEMMTWQKGGNVLLGHILVLAPLASAVARCLKLKTLTFYDYIYSIKKVIDDSTIGDTIKLYEALRLCNPGGMGKKEKYDIYNDNSINEIQSDKITLKNIFDFSKEYDLISLEYSTGFNIVVNEGLPFFLKMYEQSMDINLATVNTFLKLLSVHPDTLIIRKSGFDSALMVTNKAYDIIRRGGISTEKGLSLTKKLDEILQKEKGKMNPGTTADLVAGIIFCALISGLNF
jgi:triphosphoribosyl-dephospho-CoA synthase